MTLCDPASVLRSARVRAGLSQAALAARAGTSRATISAYECGRRRPSLEMLGRLLSAAGARQAVRAMPAPVVTPSERWLAERARRVVRVLELAEALPTRHAPRLRYPRLPCPTDHA